MLSKPAPALLLLLLWVPILGTAAPERPPEPPAADRPGLVAAFGEALAREARVEPTAPERWRIESDALGYRGDLTIETALIRKQPRPSPYAYLGVVDFRLSDLPREREDALAIRMWKQPLQTFYFREGQGWMAAHRIESERMDEELDRLTPGVASWTWAAALTSWGLPVAFLSIVLGLVVAAARQGAKARNLIRSSNEINAMARENLERARALQDEQAALIRRSQELAEDNNRLLGEILAALKAR